MLKPHARPLIAHVKSSLVVLIAVLCLMANIPVRAQSGASPTGLAVTNVGNSYLDLTWNAVPAATSYNIYRGTSSHAELTTPFVRNVAQPYYTDTKADPSKAYFYQVTAAYPSGESPKSNEASGNRSVDLLPAPNLVAVGSIARVTLSWSSIAGALSYNLYRSDDNGATFELYRSGLTGSSFADTAVLPAVSYQYFMYAVRIEGQGDKSNVVSVMPGSAVLPAPAGLAAITYYNGVQLTWNPVPGAASYNVYRGTSSGKEAAVPVSAAVMQTTFYDAPLPVTATYYYKVTAIGVAGESIKSGECSAQPAGTPLAAPALIGSSVSGSIALTWSVVSGATSYNVYRSVDGYPYTALITGTTSTTYRDSSLASGSSGAYHVCAVSSALGQGTQSNSVSLTAGTPTPVAPTGLVASVQGTSVRLTWNPVLGAQSYNIYRGNVAGGEEKLPHQTGVSQTSFYDSGLTGAKTYFYTVTALSDAGGEGGHSNEAAALAGRAPLIAPSLSASGALGRINLTWSAVANATGYDLYRSTDGNQNFILYQHSATATTFSDAGITSGLTYGYFVCATTPYGEGDASNHVSLIAGETALPAPAGLAASNQFGRVNLTWNAVPGADSYNVYRGPASGKEAAAPYEANVTQTNYADAGAVSGATYYYEVTAVSISGESVKSNEALVQANAAVLLAPTLTATGDSTKVTLTWSAISGATTYNLYRSTDGGATFALYQLGLTGVTYSDSTVTKGQTYMYFVCAANKTGQGAESNTVTVILGSPTLPAPTGLTAFSNGSSISLSWNDVPAASSYNIYRGIVAGGELAAPYVTTSTSATFTDGTVSAGKIYYYKVTAVGSTGESNKSSEASSKAGSPALAAPVLIGSAGSAQITLAWSAVAGATSYDLYRGPDEYNFTLFQSGLTATTSSDKDVTAGVQYHYAVRALSMSGLGVQSNVVSIVFGGAALPAPTGLNATSPGSYNSLTWNASPGATSYNVYRGTAPGAEGAIPIGIAGAAGYIDSKVSSSAAYYYKVTAVNAIAESASSNEASAKPLPSTLKAPSLSASPATDSILLSWGAVSGATSYNLFRSPNSYDFTCIAVGISVTSYTDSGLEAGTQQQYYLCAVNALGQGPQSNTVTAVVAGGGPASPSGLVAQAQGTGNALSWEAVPGAVSYNIYRGAKSGAESAAPIATGVTSPSYTDGSAPLKSLSYYQVTAINASAESAHSNEASAQPSAGALAAPSLSASQSASQITLNWNAVTAATSYNLFRSADNGATFSLYKAGITGSSFADTGLTTGTLYGYYLCADGAPGQGPKSNTVIVSLGSAALPAPGGLAAIPAGAANKLTWNSVPGAVSYNVYRGIATGGEGIAPYATGITAAAYGDTGIKANSGYYYQVSAVGVAGEGGRSNESHVVAGAPRLAAPILTATSGSGISLTWNTISGAASYTVYRSVDGGHAFTMYKSGLTTSSFVDTAVIIGAPYAYYVAAVNTNGLGAQSNTVTVIYGGVAPPAPLGLNAQPSGSSVILSWTADPGATSYSVYRGTSAGGEAATPIVTGLTATSYTNASLTSGTTYYYKVAAIDSVGESARSNEAHATVGIALAAPNLSAVPGPTSIALSWSAVADAASYAIYRSTDGGRTYPQYKLGLSSTTFSDTNVTAGLPYGYFVCAVASAGQGLHSNPVAVIAGGAAMPPPSSLVAQVNGAAIALTWNADPGAVTYDIYRGTAAGGEGTAPLATRITALTYSDRLVTAGTSYYYKATAINAIGESKPSNETSAKAASPVLAAPTLFGSSVASSISLSWSTVSGATSYNLYRSVEGGATSLLRSGLTATAYSDAAVSSGAAYSYNVSAVNASGQGVRSNMVKIVAGAIGSPAPSGLAAVPGGSGIQLTWNPAPSAVSYNIYRGTSANGEGLTPFATGISSATYYDSSAVSGIIYYYQVTATGTAAESGRSNEASSSVTLTALKPATLSAIGGAFAVTLNWTAVPQASEYNIYRSTDGGSTFTVLKSNLKSVTSIDSSVIAGDTYVYYVCGVNDLGQGPQSNRASATPGGVALAAPTGLTARAGTGSLNTPGVDLSWNPVQGATSYNIYSATTAGGESATPLGTSYTPSFNYPYLVNNKTYYFKVTATNSVGESAPSNEASAKTGVTPPSAPTLIGTPTANSVVLKWGGVSGATSYNIYRSLGSVVDFTLIKANVNGTTFMDSPLTAGAVVSYYVTAVNAGGESLDSNTVRLIVNATSKPDAPFLYAATDGYSNGISLSWSDASGAASYDIYRATVTGGETGAPIANIKGSTFSDVNLDDATTYYYVVVGVGSAGEGVRSNEASATIGVLPLDAPILKGVAAPGQASLSWTSVDGAVSYDLFRSTDSYRFDLIQVGIKGNSTLDTKLSNNITYMYIVCAVGPDGIGEDSNTVPITPGSALPPAPIGLTAASNGTTGIVLGWNAVPGVSSYNVYRGASSGTENVTPIATNVRSIYYQDPGQNLVVGTTYFYQVTATSSVGEGSKSNEASASLGLPQLPAPVLTAVPGSSQASLSWTASAGATGYIVYRSILNASAVFVATVNDATGYVDTGLKNGVAYTYYVAAYAPAGLGVSSNEVTVIPGSTPPAAPVNLTAAATSRTSIQLNWSLVPGLKYNIYRGTVAGGEGAAPFDTGISYASYTDTTVSTGKTYFYQITAVAAAGESLRSNQATARPGVLQLDKPILVASPASKQIALSWNPVTGAQTYTLYRSIEGQYQLTPYHVGLTAAGFTDTSVQAGVPYYYAVAASSTSGLGTQSNVASAIPGGAVPAAPQLYAEADESQVTLFWTPVAGADTYTLYRSTSSGMEASTPIVTSINPQSPICQYVDRNLKDNTTYYYMLTAENASGDGPFSPEASCTPPAGTTADFLLTALPNSIIIPQGQSDSVTISLDYLGGYSSSVSLSVTGTPTGTTASFYPQIANSSGSTLFLMPSLTASPGVYGLTVTATDGVLLHSVPVTLTVAARTSQNAPDLRVRHFDSLLPKVASSSLSGIEMPQFVSASNLQPWFIIDQPASSQYKNRRKGQAASRSITLLDEVGKPLRPIAASTLAQWKARLSKANPSEAARLHLWIGEYRLGAEIDPDGAREEFQKVEMLVGTSNPIGGLAAYDDTVAEYYQGSYKKAALRFAALANPNTAYPGYDGRLAAYWTRHAAACAGYHEERSLAGIPEPPHLDPLCGVASLSACLRALHQPYDRARLLKACPAVGDKRTLADLITAGKALGVNVRPVALDDRGLLALPKPLIAYFERDHFVAVLATDKAGVTYLCSDCGAWPGGSVHLTWEQWHLVSTGVYAAVTIPKSNWDTRLSYLDEPDDASDRVNSHLAEDGDLTDGLRVASTGSLQGLVSGQSISPHHRIVGTHSVLIPPSGFSCVYRPDAQHCIPCQLAAMDAAGGGDFGAAFGDPVNLATGEEEYRPKSDIDVYNPHGPSVSFRRIYNSMRAPQPLYQDRDFGSGWSNSYNMGVTGSFPDFYVFEPNGARIGVHAATKPSASAPPVKCSVMPGADMAVAYHYSPQDPDGFFTITLKDRTTYTTSLRFEDTGNYYISSQTDGLGNSIDFEYEVVDSAYPPPGSGSSTTHPLLMAIRDRSTGKALLTIHRAHEGTGNITQVDDNNNRSVYYHVGYFPNILADVAYYQQADHVSQIVPTNTPNPPDRYIYGYTPVAINGITTVAGAYQFLSSISVPSPTGTGFSTSHINYGPNGVVTSIVDANGNTHSYTTIDGNHTSVTVTDAHLGLINRRTVAFDASMNQESANVGQGTTYTFNDPNDPYRPDTITDPYGHVTRLNWDPYGNLVSMVDPRGTQTVNAYDHSQFEIGELTSIQTGSKFPTTIAYNEPSGTVKSVTYPQPGSAGTSAVVTASFTYDILGNLLTATTPGNNTTPSKVTTLNYVLDGSYKQAAAIGEPLTVTDSLGYISHFRYDVRGNVISAIDAAGIETRQSYNIAEQPATTIFPATGQTGSGHSTSVNQYLYPGGPLLHSLLTDEDGSQQRQTNYTYGAEGEFLARSGEAEPVTVAYDGLYRVTSVKDGNGNTTAYGYDPNGYVNSIIYPDGKAVQFPVHDGLGNPLKRIDGNKVETDYVYADINSLLSDIKYPSSSSLNVHITYDAYSRPSTVTDGTGFMAFTFDDNDHVTSRATTYKGLSQQTIAYLYNLDGSRQSMTTPAGVFSYAYDGAGRMTQLTDPSLKTTRYSYLNNDWLQGITLGNGVSVGYTYNARGLLTDLINKATGGILSEFGSASASTAMQYDAAGNRTAMGVAIPGVPKLSGATAYTYDGRDQLIQEQSTRNGGYNNSFVFDGATTGTSAGAGNPTTFRGISGNTFNADNQITAFKSSTGAPLGPFAYDGNGNPTTYAGSTFKFDPENHLTGAGTAQTDGYNAIGLRAWKKVGGVATFFLYDGITPVVELTAIGDVSAYNTFGEAGLVSRTEGGTTTYYTFDPQGNVVQRLDTTGKVLNTNLNDAFGIGVSTGATSDPFGFGGQWGYYTDHETGLVLCGLRYYDPKVGRWITRDPIEFAGGINAYGYVTNNAVTKVDELGLQVVDPAEASSEALDQLEETLKMQSELEEMVRTYNILARCKFIVSFDKVPQQFRPAIMASVQRWLQNNPICPPPPGPSCSFSNPSGGPELTMPPTDILNAVPGTGDFGGPLFHFEPELER